MKTSQEYRDGYGDGFLRALQCALRLVELNLPREDLIKTLQSDIKSYQGN